MFPYFANVLNPRTTKPFLIANQPGKRRGGRGLGLIVERLDLTFNFI